MRISSVAAAVVLLLGAPAVGAAAEHGESREWTFGTVRHSFYDGNVNDLLTGGLGKTGLGLAPPAFADPLHPTSAELRTLAIYNNYRALVDISPKGGYGVLFGPNIDLKGADTLGEGKIAGDEYIAYADDGSGRKNVTTMVQIPSSFDPSNACIVTAVSSGSRGVYGAIATAGEWGLKRGCAVAYSDKGTGNGAHDLQADTINLIDGIRQDALTAGAQSNFTADLSAAELAAFDAATPDRFAYKHAHSQQNPEQDWGLHTLLAVKFAFRILNAQFSGQGHHEHVRFTKANTLVIASSASNGAGAAIAAAEQDEDGLIDGVAVSEPQIQPRHVKGLLIQRGSGPPFAGGGKALYDYFTLANLLQPCAALSARVAASPFLFAINPTLAANRCAALGARGVLTSTGTAAQADEALEMLHDAGWQPESDLLHASHYATAAVPAVTLTYANAYGRFGVADNLCGYSFAAISATGTPAAIAPASVAQIFASGNGVPPTGGIEIINNDSVGGPLLDAISVSPSSGMADYNADGAFCLRGLYTDHADPHQSERVASGIEKVLRNGDLHGKPVLIVQGRSDTLVPVNFASRYYLGLNRLVEGRDSGLRYYEITNAQHFDAFIDLLPGYDTLLVPLHYYLIQALNLMYAHLKDGAPLPPSQVVYTVPRGGSPGAAPSITTANVPLIDPAPAADHLITFSGRTVHVPQ